MTTLHLGVADIPYSNAPEPGQKKPASGTQTTGDVAEWLENKYHVMQIFFVTHEKEIAASMDNVFVGMVDNILMGAPTPGMPLDAINDPIKKMFSKFIETAEIEKLGYPGVPTKAALAGINHRFADPKTGTRRPSFRDTGLYESAFRAWLET